MPCPQNAIGQSACMIVPHPDHPNLSFCTTCNRRFQDAQADEATSPGSPSKPNPGPGFFPILLGVTVLIMITSALQSEKNIAPPNPSPVNQSSPVQ